MAMTRIKNIFSFGATGTTQSQPLNENGFIRALTVDVPNFTNAITVAVTVLDPDGYVVYTRAAIANNAVTAVTGALVAELGGIPVNYGYKLKVDLSGVAGGAGGDVKVMGYMAT